MADLALALAVAAPPPRALSEHRALRVSTLFLLYVAQGLQLGLINFALPAWLDGLGGIPAMFLAIAVSSVIAAALAFAARVGR